MVVPRCCRCTTSCPAPLHHITVISPTCRVTLSSSIHSVHPGLESCSYPLLLHAVTAFTECSWLTSEDPESLLLALVCPGWCRQQLWAHAVQLQPIYLVLLQYVLFFYSCFLCVCTTYGFIHWFAQNFTLYCCLLFPGVYLFTRLYVHRYTLAGP